MNQTIKEGSHWRISSLLAGKGRGGLLRLSTSRNTKWDEIKHINNNHVYIKYYYIIGMFL